VQITSEVYRDVDQVSFAEHLLSPNSVLYIAPPSIPSGTYSYLYNGKCELVHTSVAQLRVTREPRLASRIQLGRHSAGEIRRTCAGVGGDFQTFPSGG